MIDRVTIFSRIASGVICIVGGSAMQVMLWETPDRSRLDAILFGYGIPWFVYILVSHALGERILRMVSRFFGKSGSD